MSKTLEAFRALFTRLDPYQRVVASLNPSGNVRVLAGAGAGKTLTLVAWVARLLHEKVLTPGDVIVTTFTRKAAEELVSRLAPVVPEGALDPEGRRPGTLRVGTFHSLALRSLRQTDPQKWSMTRCMDVDSKASGIPSTGLLWNRIVGWAGRDGLPGTGAPGLELDDVDARAYSLAVEVARSSGHEGESLRSLILNVEHESGLRYLLTAFDRYEAVKKSLGCWDFSDALTGWLTGLRSGAVTDSARLVVVDEAQDNDARQLEIARLLARKGSLALVGDVRQSIYGWRGAFPTMLAEADTRLGAQTLVMPTNYRSASAIVLAGNAVAAGQTWDVGEPAIPARPETGIVTGFGGDTPEEEAARFAEEILAASAAERRAYSDYAVLVRTNALAGVAEAALVAASIPCVVVGGTPFFARKDVKDALAYVSLSFGDDEEALARIVNRPKRFLGAAFVEAVKRASPHDLLDKIEVASGTLRGSTQRGAARSLAALIANLRADSWPDAVSRIVALLQPTTPEGAGEADDDKGGILSAFKAVALKYKDATGFLDFAHRCANEVKAAASEGDVPAGRVVISTLHKAKGLEWPVVFLSASASVFPHARADGEARLAEERRLYYVGVTRARDVLHLTWANTTLMGKESGPSPFHSLVTLTAPASEPAPKAKAPTVRKAKKAEVRTQFDLPCRCGRGCKPGRCPDNGPLSDNPPPAPGFCPECNGEVVLGTCQHGVAAVK